MADQPLIPGSSAQEDDTIINNTIDTAQQLHPQHRLSTRAQVQQRLQQ